MRKTSELREGLGSISNMAHKNVRTMFQTRDHLHTHTHTPRVIDKIWVWNKMSNQIWKIRVSYNSLVGTSTFNFKNSARMKEKPLLKMFLKLPNAKLKKVVNTASETVNKKEKMIRIKLLKNTWLVTIYQFCNFIWNQRPFFSWTKKIFSTKVCKFFLILFQPLSCI